MRRLTTLILLLIATLSYATAQDGNGENTIYINKSGDNVKPNSDGGISLTLNGMRINFGGSGAIETTIAPSESSKYRNRVQLGFIGIEAPRYNHFAALELGSSIFTHTDYSAYSDEEAAQLAFTNSKSVYMAFNLVTMNAPLNKNRSLVFSASFGFTSENYTFAKDYTMEMRDGMMHAVALDPSIKKSKLTATYIHIPATLDWNIDKNWFLAVGANVDILMSSWFAYKKPRTTIEGIATLRPVQIGLTARVGWKRLYGFINYSPMQMFKPSTGPKMYRMSAGVGFWY